jgi:hypothetical protein
MPPEKKKKKKKKKKENCLGSTGFRERRRRRRRRREADSINTKNGRNRLARCALTLLNDSRGTSWSLQKDIVFHYHPWGCEIRSSFSNSHSILFLAFISLSQSQSLWWSSIDFQKWKKANPLLLTEEKKKKKLSERKRDRHLQPSPFLFDWQVNSNK